MLPLWYVLSAVVPRTMITVGAPLAAPCLLSHTYLIRTRHKNQGGVLGYETVLSAARASCRRSAPADRKLALESSRISGWQRLEPCRTYGRCLLRPGQSKPCPYLIELSVKTL